MSAPTNTLVLVAGVCVPAAGGKCGGDSGGEESVAGEEVLGRERWVLRAGDHCRRIELRRIPLYRLLCAPLRFQTGLLLHHRPPLPRLIFFGYISNVEAGRC